MKQGSVLRKFGFFMAAIYLALGLILLTTDAFPGLFPNAHYRNLFSWILLAYALFRMVVSIWKYKKEKDETA
jgi:hypothetical protein